MQFRKLAAVALFVFLSCLLQAQIKLNLQNSIQTDLEKVLKDFPNHFKNIKGEELKNNVQSTDYRSVVVLKESEQCIITKYSSKTKEVYSWQADMLTTEDFLAAKKKFKSCLHRSIICR